MKSFFIFLIFLLFLFFLFLSFWLVFRNNPPLPSLDEQTEVKLDGFRQGMKKVVFQDQEFLFLEEKINEPAKLDLLPNFEQKLASTELFEENHCRFLANGGFYDEDDQPLGWFFSQRKLFKKEIKSSLFNGFLFKNEENKIFISKSLPTESVIWGLQTGPMLIFDQQPLKISLVRDQPARRIVAAINQDDELVFLVITGNESLASGPLLADLPFLLVEIRQELGESFGRAINLDGGTASAFINSQKTIKEYTWIGSFFCLLY